MPDNPQPGAPDPQGGSAVPSSYDEELRHRATKLVKARQEFRQHLSAYLIVNAALVGMWAVTGAGYFWPFWPLVGWGIGLAFHATSLRSVDPVPTATKIETEVQRLRELDARRGPGPAIAPPTSSPASAQPPGSATPSWPTPPAGGEPGQPPAPQDRR